ncbi:hypothetical protein LVD15_19860 [Fulvivirga maritima]|uniref:hypothetical protein n=1 Tax=Fulvivirga maritima TaxID=2904247 RepID=UPI001F330490|nr:hypothetical protein [Fulvivirga maritima]UII25543.1 hypothetical protein LVD15_19860 [Fulvivirga maritima]
MKYLMIMTMMLAFGYANTAAAQEKERKDLKGPAAKNYKVWKDKSPKTAMVTVPGDELQGPEAKNHKIWKAEPKEEAIVVTKSSRNKYMGPKAKNYKLWRDND